MTIKERMIKSLAERIVWIIKGYNNIYPEKSKKRIDFEFILDEVRKQLKS